MFWRKKRKKVEELADDAGRIASDLAEKTMTIGPTCVALLLGAAALTAAAAYVLHKQSKSKKVAE
jgi:hypothetical protein